jgi:uncharacterized membrane protein YbhN (UPF0104 family)
MINGMKLKVTRSVAAVFVLVLTATAFIYYFAKHPEVWHQLTSTPIDLLVILFIGYICFIGSLALINSATLRLCRTAISNEDSLLLTMYSAIINFFGPLQSGPAFRALYVNKKYGTKLRNFTSATLMYYLFYALFSGAFLLSGILGWWLLALAIVGILGLFAINRSQSSRLQRFKQLDLHGWYFLAGATLLQVSIQAVIYFFELHSVVPGVSWSQVVIYTGAANFALFVSITPGAIGFRESFLLFSQNLHHIDSSAIVVATTIDRAVYVSLLLLMTIFMFATHTSRRFTKAK